MSVVPQRAHAGNQPLYNPALLPVQLLRTLPRSDRQEAAVPRFVFSCIRSPTRSNGYRPYVKDQVVLTHRADVAAPRPRSHVGPKLPVERGPRQRAVVGTEPPNGTLAFN